MIIVSLESPMLKGPYQMPRIRSCKPGDHQSWRTNGIVYRRADPCFRKILFPLVSGIGKNPVRCQGQRILPSPVSPLMRMMCVSHSPFLWTDSSNISIYKNIHFGGRTPPVNIDGPIKPGSFRNHGLAGLAPSPDFAILSIKYILEICPLNLIWFFPSIKYILWIYPLNMMYHHICSGHMMSWLICVGILE